MQGRWAQALITTVGWFGCVSTTTWAPDLCSAAAPIVEIIRPVEPFKVRAGVDVAVAVRVAGVDSGVTEWRLVAEDESASQLVVAQGSGEVSGVVATLSADGFLAGAKYTLRLQAGNAIGEQSEDQEWFSLSAPKYALVPLEAGNLRQQLRGGLTMDGSGTLTAMGGDPFGEIWLLDSMSNTLRKFMIPLANTDGFRLSADGRRLVFAGSNPWILRILSLDTMELKRVPLNISAFFGVDRVGQRIAVYAVEPESNTLQFYVYDDAAGEIRQLTNHPRAVDQNVRCPRYLVGTMPVISGDGETVVFVSSAGLGLVPDEPLGCHFFAYQYSTNQLRHVTTISPNDSTDLPSISSDGRWYGFTLTRFGSTPIVDYPALLDLQSGELTAAVGGITEYTSFDSVVVDDGNLMVISTQADLDARVGNSDHNMELFVLNRADGEFTQVTETTGGIGRFAGGCSVYEPKVGSGARAIAFNFKIGSGGTCQLDGPQKQEIDGFTFRRVRAVLKRPGNLGPTLLTPRFARARIGQQITFDVWGTDADGDPVVFFAQEVGGTDIPLRADFDDNRNGTATFVWAPVAEDVGTKVIRVASFDEGGGEMTQDVRLEACAQIVEDGDEAQRTAAIFATVDSGACHRADGNMDGSLTAADLVAFIYEAPRVAAATTRVGG